VEAQQSHFGTLPDGRSVDAITLMNARGVSATILSYGATLQSVIAPDRAGKGAEITLGHSTLEPYLSKPEYFGSTVGRFANRIAQGRFMLDGVTYDTPRNNGTHALHGGVVGFDKLLWEVVEVRAEKNSGHVVLRHTSPDGDQGYPGALMVTATFSLNEANVLRIDYAARTDRPTVVNITNHAYWNLAGEGSAHGAMGHGLVIAADSYLPVDAALIPTGERRQVAGTAFDFRQPRMIGERLREAEDQQILFGRGYDHNWIVQDRVAPVLHGMARLSEPTSGRSLELWSNQPGVQFYSGNFLDGTTVGRSGRLYRQGDAVVLEPQNFPDAVNRPDFPSARLDPGQEYRNVIEFRISPGIGPE